MAIKKPKKNTNIFFRITKTENLNLLFFEQNQTGTFLLIIEYTCGNEYQFSK